MYVSTVNEQTRRSRRVTRALVSGLISEFSGDSDQYYYCSIMYLALVQDGYEEKNNMRILSKGREGILVCEGGCNSIKCRSLEVIRIESTSTTLDHTSDPAQREFHFRHSRS
jgi:hypothetical protein